MTKLSIIYFNYALYHGYNDYLLMFSCVENKYNILGRHQISHLETIRYL